MNNEQSTMNKATELLLIVDCSLLADYALRPY